MTRKPEDIASISSVRPTQQDAGDESPQTVLTNSAKQAISSLGLEVEQSSSPVASAPLEPVQSQATSSEAAQPNGPGNDSGTFSVLKNVSFLNLWGSQVLSQVADKIYLVFMIALIAEHYQALGQSVSGWVSSIMIAFTIPAVVFGSVAGVMVDWWP
ncbi:MAG: MFS transporter, partial [Cyanobacteria bacterium P01_F01_bin.42]